MSLKLHFILLGIALFYTISPILLALVAFSLAHVLGCEPKESGFVCEGRPFLSELFSALSVIHWFGLFTVPTGGIVSIVLGLSLGVRLLS
jgi:hypothetical protein